MKGRIIVFCSLVLFFAQPILTIENNDVTQNNDEAQNNDTDDDNDNNNNGNDTEIETLKEKLQNLRAQIKSDKFPKNYSEEHILLLKKKMEELKNLKNGYVAGEVLQKGKDDEGSTSDDPSDESELHNKQFFEQGVKGNDDEVRASGNDASVVGESVGSTGSGGPGGAVPSAGISSETGSTGQGVSGGQAAQSTQVQQDQGAASTESDSQVQEASQSQPTLNPPSSPSAPPQAPANPAVQVKHLDTLYDELLAGENKKNIVDEGENHKKYNDFRKQYDKLVLNQDEYDISLKLLGNILSKGATDPEKKENFVKTFKKVLHDEQFSHEFKNLITGVYSFAKRHTYLNGKRTKTDTYDKMIDYISDLMNML
ncbi:merozoite surface protein 7 [Plasmodium gonderi]|uniref:Merozoite surface protein 7 n=1 Tax=Plasmodium gonderi TaxID=77519 RepID=A0A1Y1JL91_PLAGO|nr:merozoite surface protein 7 [Plasmodium gonderi]GAW82225.1 merozoite surface protein 7 [Plasmodium gonderi]